MRRLVEEDAVHRESLAPCYPSRVCVQLGDDVGQIPRSVSSAHIADLSDIGVSRKLVESGRILLVWIL